MAALEPFDAGRTALRRALEDRSSPLPLRRAAALTLSAWRDPAGAPLLLDDLRDNGPGATESLLFLSALGPSTLGWVPDASEEDRAAAIGRWRAVLAR